MKNVNRNHSVYDYLDYRQFLQDHYKARKGADKKFSLAFLATRTHRTKMSVKLLLDRKRHLADQHIALFAHAFGLREAEAKYFERLVFFNKAKTSEERDRRYEKLLRSKNSPLRCWFLQESQLKLLERWYYFAIAEMSYLRGFRKDAHWIRKRLYFRLPLAEVREALEYLDSSGMLLDGSAEKSKVKVPEGFQAYLYKQYALRQIDLSREALETQSKDEREIFNLTISVSEEKYQRAKRMVEEFRHRLHDTLAGTGECTRVIQVNMQLFTLAYEERAEGECHKEAT